MPFAHLWRKLCRQPAGRSFADIGRRPSGVRGDNRKAGSHGLEECHAELLLLARAGVDAVRADQATEAGQGDAEHRRDVTIRAVPKQHEPLRARGTAAHTSSS